MCIRSSRSVDVELFGLVVAVQGIKVYVVQVCEVLVQVYCYIWKETRLSLRFPGSFLMAFLKDPSESSMVAKILKINLIVGVEQVSIRIMSPKTHVLFLQNKLIGSGLVVVNSSFWKRQGS